MNVAVQVIYCAANEFRDGVIINKDKDSGSKKQESNDHELYQFGARIASAVEINTVRECLNEENDKVNDRNAADELTPEKAPCAKRPDL